MHALNNRRPRPGKPVAITVSSARAAVAGIALQHLPLPALSSDRGGTGLVKLKGQIEAGPQQLLSPLGRRPCVAYVTIVVRKGLEWWPYYREERLVPFVLRENAESIVVENHGCLLGLLPDRIGYDPVFASLEPDCEAMLRASRRWLNLNRSLAELRTWGGEPMWYEVTVPVGETVTVYGRYSGASGTTAPYRTGPPSDLRLGPGPRRDDRLIITRL